MNKSQVINPHAMFFEKVFSRTDVASDLIQHYLPPKTVEKLDLSTIQPLNKSFISKALKVIESDLLFSVLTKTGDPIFIYLLLEHKSFVDRWVMLQLLTYIVKICEDQHAHNKQKRVEIRQKNMEQGKPENEGIETEYLNPVIPVVIYHGKAQWNVKNDISELFNKGWTYRKYLPNYKFELINTAEYADNDFKGSVILRVSLMAMKHFFMDDFETKVPELLNLLVDLIEQQDSEIGFLEVLLCYLSTNRNYDSNWLRTTLKRTFKNKGEKIMNTIADMWIEKGEKRGEKRGEKIGEKIGIKKIVARQLSKKFNMRLNRITPRLNPLPADAIMELGERLLSMNTFEEAYQWINKRKKQIKMR
jgi:hypothetical protein